MNFKASIPGYGPVHFTPVTPPSLAEYSIAGSRVYAAVDKYGKLMLQEISTSMHITLLAVFQCEEDTNILIEYPAPAIRVHFALKGYFHLEFDGLDKLLMKPNTANMYFSPHLNGIGVFQKHQTYVMLDIICQSQALGKLRDYFPILYSFLEKTDRNETVLLTANIISISREIWMVIDNIIHNTTGSNSLPIYIDHHCRNLLFMVLEEAALDEPQLSKPVPPETETLMRAESIISKDLAHRPLVSRIARTVGISKSKLEKEFKELFGDSPVKYWRKQGLKKAADELLTTDKPVREIAALFGFRRASSFISSFKATFNATPEEWRKK